MLSTLLNKLTYRIRKWKRWQLFPWEVFALITVHCRWSGIGDENESRFVNIALFFCVEHLAYINIIKFQFLGSVYAAAWKEITITNFAIYLAEHFIFGSVINCLINFWIIVLHGRGHCITLLLLYHSLVIRIRRATYTGFIEKESNYFI